MLVMAKGLVSAKGKLLSPPPGEYGRKTEIDEPDASGSTANLNELTGKRHKVRDVWFNSTQREETHLGRLSYVCQAEDLTRIKQRGSAWPSQARAVKCALK